MRQPKAELLCLVGGFLDAAGAGVGLGAQLSEPDVLFGLFDGRAIEDEHLADGLDAGGAKLCGDRVINFVAFFAIVSGYVHLDETVIVERALDFL